MLEVTGFGVGFYLSTDAIFSDKPLSKTESRVELADWLIEAAIDARKRVKHAIFADCVTIYFYTLQIPTLQLEAEETNRLLISVSDTINELKLAVPGCHNFESDGPNLVLCRWSETSPIEEIVVWFGDELTEVSSRYFFADLVLSRLDLDRFKIYDLLEEIINAVNEELAGKCKTV